MSPKTCDQCGEEYEAGTGTSESTKRRIRLSERFCCDSCRDAYEESFIDDTLPARE